MQIVIAWVEDTVEWDGKPYARDRGAQPTMRSVRLAKACMWLQHGTALDVEKASIYASAEGYRVFTFDAAERDPLGVAKRAVLRGAQ